MKTPLSLDYRLDKESLNRLLVRSKNLTGYVPGSQFEPGSARISLRISNPAISSSGNSQPARLIKPALAIQIPDTRDYGSIFMPASHNEQNDEQGYCLDDYFLAVGSGFTSLVDWTGAAFKCIWKTVSGSESA